MRDKFPIFQTHPDLIYLDSAATTHKPYSVLEKLFQFYSSEYGTVHRAVYDLALQADEKYHRSRLEAAQFFSAEEEEIVFTRGTTSAINFIAQALGDKFIEEGDEIVLSIMEHHSNIVPWHILAKKKRAKLLFLPIDDRGVLQWENAFSKRTKIVSLAHMSNVTGTINPIAKIAQKAKEKNAIVVVDGAQAACHIPIDVKELGCDFYAFSAHKCYGPTGLGILFGKKELLEKFDPIEGGGDMIEEVYPEYTTYQKPPLRFEAGTPNIASIVACKESLDFVKKHSINPHLLPMATEGMEKISGLKILGTAPEKGPIITFTIEGMHPLDIATFCNMKSIAIRSGHLCAQPLLRFFGLKEAARVSFGVYNTEKDVEKLLSALKELSLSLQIR